MVQHGVDVRILGPLEMDVNGAAVALGTPKQRAVLAMLVINRNSTVGVDSLIDAVWGTPTPSGARATIHSYVSNLRRLMSSGGSDARGVLVRVSPGYRLVLGDDACDLGRFAVEKTAGIHAAADGEFELASRHLSAALAQWRGQVLDDLRRKFGFADAFADALAEEKVVVQTAYAEAEIACGRSSSVISDLELLITEHPYREPLWAQLISAYYLCERQSDALDAYRRLKNTLVEDLGVDPGPTIRALYRRILRQEPLDVQSSAKASADATIVGLEPYEAAHDGPVKALLRSATGDAYPLAGAVTRIGRNADNDIVLADGKVSRHHAVIIDTGTCFVITDLKSANGVYVLGRRIQPSATLGNQHRIRIGDHEFVLEPSTGAARHGGD